LCNMNTGKFEKGKVYNEQSIINANLSASDKGIFQPIERKVLSKEDVEGLMKMKQKLVDNKTHILKNGN
ncbi:hypothetical protein ABK046_52060, partial [Streptomyces caeruleatus]